MVVFISERQRARNRYQRGRASITGLRLNDKRGMKTGRLIGVACLDLFAFLSLSALEKYDPYVKFLVCPLKHEDVNETSLVAPLE